MELKKNPEANLEKKKLSLLMIGLIATAGVVLMAFEYTQYDVKEKLVQTTKMNDLEDEQVMEFTPPPPPPPAPPPPPTIIQNVEVVEDDKQVDENQVIITENTEKVEVKEIVIEEKEEVVAEEIFDVVEENPEYQGGLQEMYKFLGENMKYPPMARESGVQGKVYVQFVVEKDGKVNDVTVLRGIGSGCDEEAVRVVKMMPNWKPGKQRGKPVRVRYKLPVTFRLG